MKEKKEEFQAVGAAEDDPRSTGPALLWRGERGRFCSSNSKDSNPFKGNDLKKICPKHQGGRDAPSESGVMMRPKEKVKTHVHGLLKHRREGLILRTDLGRVRLAGAIDWDGLAESFRLLCTEQRSKPGIPIQTLAGLVLLHYTFGLSDEQVVRGWSECPFRQLFCGEEFLQHELPVDILQISRWRKRVGKGGVERT